MLNFYKSILGCGSLSDHEFSRQNGRHFTSRVTSINDLQHTYIDRSDGINGTFHNNTPQCPAYDNCVSRRAQRVLACPSVGVRHQQIMKSDMYDPATNPEGYIDLGIAENKLCADLITEKLKSIQDDIDDHNLRYYPDVRGLPRNSLKAFLDVYFKPAKPVKADNIVVACGVTALLDALSFALADEGEYIMTPSPYYYRIKNDLSERATVNTLDVPLIAKPKTNWIKPYTLDADCLEDAYLDAKKKGKVVKAIVLVNPNNPLGDVYSVSQLYAVLEFATRHKLHVIVDEIYAMSVFNPDVTFTSILSLFHPDPDRIHFLWGFSKDFGLSGYRCGVLYSTNQKLVAYLASLGLYQETAPVIQSRLMNIIDDNEWLSNVYFPTLHERLRSQHKLLSEEISKCGASVHNSCAGIFIWMDASMFLPEKTFKGEEWLFEQFFKEKVFLLPGKSCYSKEPGYFRVVFSLDDNSTREGLKRIQSVLRKLQNLPVEETSQ